MSQNGYLHHISEEELQLSADCGCEGCATICGLDSGDSTLYLHQPKPEDTSDLPSTQIICTAIKAYESQEKLWGVQFWQPNLVGKPGCLVKVAFCFVEPGDSLSNFAIGRPVAESSNSEIAFATAAHWLHDCVEAHYTCCPPSITAPTRLVHVGALDTEPHIVTTIGEEFQWATLSHCWGSSRHGITTSANIEDRKKKLEMTQLPALHRDAIKIVQKLGLDYLWIDSLCIIQDSKADWTSESVKMDQYYAGAHLNISPSGASDSNMGIFATASQHRAELRSLGAFPCISHTMSLIGVLHFRKSRPGELGSYLSEVEKPLLIRAWVLQEHIFSRRILWYDTDQLRWQCHETKENESVHQPNQFSSRFSSHPGKGLFVMPVIQPRSEIEDNGNPSVLPNRLGGMEVPATTTKGVAEVDEKKLSDLLEWWYSTLSSYTNRKMTYPDDRLPGIAGLAKEISRRTAYTYICGLWREDIIRGLCWGSPGTRLQVTLESTPPSWSWASTSGLDSLGLLLGGKFGRKWFCRSPVPSYDAELVDIDVVNEGGDVYGRVESASLTLRGRWKYANEQSFSLPPVFNSGGQTRHLIDRIYDLNYLMPEQIMCTLDTPPDIHASSEKDLGKNVIYFQLRKWEHSFLRIDGEITLGLILEPVDGSEKLYRRIGIAEIPESDGETSRWPTKTVVII